ncbi:hypothetical protein D3C81_1941150 [compost metagenome]
MVQMTPGRLSVTFLQVGHGQIQAGGKTVRMLLNHFFELLNTFAVHQQLIIPLSPDKRVHGKLGSFLHRHLFLRLDRKIGVLPEMAQFLGKGQPFVHHFIAKPVKHIVLA